jgi:hypothetical protein
MVPKWSSKFELKPPGSGKWVFVPTEESKLAGAKIKAFIQNCWSPPSYYYHLRSGGHVEAVKTHLGHTTFLHVDIQNFFGSINRSRVTRNLKAKFSYEVAREIANASTVRHPDNKSRYIIPYGFVQSQILAALCLDQSRLGTYLDKLCKQKDVALSVYVDDIIVSCTDVDQARAILVGLIASAESAGFTLNSDKQEGPAAEITAFNILVSNDSMAIHEDRLAKFVKALAVTSSEHQRAGIFSYVKSVNVDQSDSLSA